MAPLLVLLALLAGLLVVLAVGATAADYLMHHAARAAADPDKETAPRGWAPPPAAAHARTAAARAKLAARLGVSHG